MKTVQLKTAFLSFSSHFFQDDEQKLLVPSNAKTSAKQLSNLGKTKQAAGDVFGTQGQPEHIFSVTTMFNFFSQPREISNWLALIVALPLLLTYTFSPSCVSHTLQVQKTMKTVHNKYFQGHFVKYYTVPDWQAQPSKETTSVMHADTSQGFSYLKEVCNRSNKSKAASSLCISISQRSSASLLLWQLWFFLGRTMSQLTHSPYSLLLI